jgi:hypothetical protein
MANTKYSYTTPAGNIVTTRPNIHHMLVPYVPSKQLRNVKLVVYCNVPVYHAGANPGAVVRHVAVQPAHTPKPSTFASPTFKTFSGNSCVQQALKWCNKQGYNVVTLKIYPQ